MAWKNFQNGYPLYASELNNYLMNQAVATFASSAERASVLTSPVEGQVTWLQDTNAFQVYNGSAWVDINDNTDAIQKSLLTTAGDTIYATGSATPARLALGSTGQVLTSNGSAPYWATPSAPAGGGLTLLSTTTLSGTTTTINITNNSYIHLYIRMEGVYPTAASPFWIVPNTSTLVTNWVGVTGQSASWSSNANSNIYPTAGPNLNAYASISNFDMTIFNYSSTWRKNFHVYGYFDSNAYSDVTSFAYGSTRIDSAITSLQFKANQSLTGTVKIYGVK